MPQSCVWNTLRLGADPVRLRACSRFRASFVLEQVLNIRVTRYQITVIPRNERIHKIHEHTLGRDEKWAWDDGSEWVGGCPRFDKQ